MKIGEFYIDNKMILAPMAGISDHSFRHICRREGCGLVFSEMISAKGLMGYKKQEVQELACNLKKDKPIAIQFFGSDPQVMAEAAKIAETVFFADIVDINMACPAKKILRNKEGAWLMRQPALAAEIMETVVKAVSIPVTVKIRKGWEDFINAVDFSLMARDVGIKAVSVHGRTVEQGFSGKSDRTILKEIKSKIDIPVIGSGDVWEPHDIRDMLDNCRCDGVMVARGALGNPWIFSRTEKWMRTGIMPSPPTREEKVEKALTHLKLLIEEKGEFRGAKEMRKHAHWYLKYSHRAGRLKEMVNKALSENDYKIIFSLYTENSV